MNRQHSSNSQLSPCIIVFAVIMIFFAISFCSSVFAASLSVTLKGGGGGTVTSDPTGISCAAANCSADFSAGSAVSLLPTPDAASIFSGWSGACTNTAGNCSVTMDGDKTVIASFTAAPMAMIGTTGYATLAAAYSAANSGDVIKALASEMPDSSLDLYAAKDVTISGGYNADFSGKSQVPTSLRGTLSISSGSLHVDGLAIVSDDTGLPDQCTGACNAATPVYPTIFGDGGLGNVTMYSTTASDGGACIYGTTNVMYYAAMSVDVVPGDAQGQWQGGKICGQCVEVTVLTSQGPKAVVVRIMDKCPDAYCGIDLGGLAPGAIMLDGFGRYTGKWRFVSCDGHPEVSDGLPTLDVLLGSNPWWSRVHVRNAPTATDSIEWKDASGETHGYFSYSFNPENSFEVPVNDVLQSGMSSVLITVHYVDGRTATVTLTPGQLATESASYPLD